MSNEEMKKELERLRAEVAALSASRAKEAAQAQEDKTTPEESPSSQATVDAKEVKSQMDELLELLETEVRDLPTITCLLVFSLGIVMGRFMR